MMSINLVRADIFATTVCSLPAVNTGFFGISFPRGEDALSHRPISLSECPSLRAWPDEIGPVHLWKSRSLTVPSYLIQS
jgi:hypothetical protein